jgi:hypothetical protein
MFDSATYQKRRCNLREKVGDGLILTIRTIHTNFARTALLFTSSDILIRDMPVSSTPIAEKNISSEMMLTWTISSGWDHNPA